VIIELKLSSKTSAATLEKRVLEIIKAYEQITGNMDNHPFLRILLEYEGRIPPPPQQPKN
tara:strand:- start:5097 stop:5276 length:180 start_codon:yes stop_codon:yes gene_type:complete